MKQTVRLRLAEARRGGLSILARGITSPCAVLSVLLLLSAFGAYAQTPTGTIAGTITDATGAAVPGAKVTIFNVNQNREDRVLTTDASGTYVAPYLPVSTYKVTVEAKGFRQTTREGIVLNVYDKLTVDFSLQVGELTQAVTVTAEPIQVESASSEQATTVVGTQVREMALITRNYEQLVALMPGVVSNSVDQLYPGVSVPGGTATIPYSINGSRNSMNSWMVDGADNVDRGSNQTLLNTPSVDALEEFKVARSNYEADMGRAGGAQIMVVTKSGSSSFHGDVYEFVRNNAFAANNFYNNATNVNLGPDGKANVPPLRYNNFGWTLGGPIYIPNHYNKDKNKTFFFVSEEFRRIITYTTPTAVLPTPAEVSGTFPHPVCTSFTSSGSCAAGATTTQITQIDPVAQQYIKDIYSRITLPSGTNTLVIPARNFFGFEQELYKIDQMFGSKLQVSARFLRDQIPTTEPGGLFQGGALPVVYQTSTNAPGHNWMIHSVATFSPTWLNEAGYNFSYGAIISNPVGLANSNYSPDVKVPLPFANTLTQIPSLGFSSGTGVGTYGPYRDFNRSHQLFDNVSKAYKDHAIKFGFIYYHYQKTENNAGSNQGSFAFSPSSVPSGTSTFEQSWANFLLGNASSFTQASQDITPDIRANQYEMYVQDDWRFRPNLTFNFGVRYSNYRQPTDAKGENVNFDPTVYSAAKAAQLTSSGNLVSTTPLPYLNGIILGGQGSPYGSKVSTEDNKNFAPRVGFAWDPFKTGKTSVRGGYGIFYDATLFGIYEQNIFGDPPVVNSISIPNTTLDNPGGGTASVSFTPKALHATTSAMKTPYMQQWNLEIQREVAHALQLNLAYVGSKGTHLLGIIDINTVAPGLAYSSGLASPSTVYTSANEALLNVLRPYQGFNAINTLEPWFNSNYHSLQFSGQKRFAGNSLLGFAYTFGKVLTDSATDRSSAAQNAYNFHDGEYGRATFDRTHVFNLNFVYEIPVFRHQQGLAGKALGGWQVSGIASYYTGLPTTVTVTGTAAWSGDPAALGIIGSSSASLRTDLSCNPNSGGAETRYSWFNGSCFTPVPAGAHRPGNEGRGVVIGPGYQGWNLSLSKSLAFGREDRYRFQLRGEATNAFNHSNPSGFGSLNPTSSLFNTITSYRDPRLIQIGAKFYF